MGKRLFAKVAAEVAVLAGNNTQGEELMRTLLAKKLARLFEEESPRFDRSRFLAACGVKEEG